MPTIAGRKQHARRGPQAIEKFPGRDLVDAASSCVHVSRALVLLGLLVLLVSLHTPHSVIAVPHSAYPPPASQTIAR